MDLEILKKAYVLGNHFLAERTAKQRRSCAGNQESLANVQALNDACEEVIAIDYDLGRFEAQALALASDESDKAKELKAWLIETSIRLVAHRAVLVETIKACGAKP